MRRADVPRRMPARPKREVFVSPIPSAWVAFVLRAASGPWTERSVFADECLTEDDEKALVAGGGRRKTANHRPVVVDSVAGRQGPVVTQDQFSPKSRSGGHHITRG